MKRVVNSPTFNIIKEYKGRLPLYHMDVYRLAESEEDLGFDEYFYGEGITVVEWAHLIEAYLPNEKLQISLFHAEMTQEKLYSSQLEIAILDYVRSYYKMKVLAIDTSNYVMGVSLIEEGKVIGEIITNLTKTILYVLCQL